jgi:signal peptidase I
MAASRSPRADGAKPSPKPKDRAAEIANTFEWLVTAFILAFVFRAFVMEAFRIPTGSMADTLMGAHFRLRCPECGFRYEYGFVPSNYRLPQDTIPPGAVPIQQATRCPSCGFHTSRADTLPVANGDRILVLKCIYQFLEPKRWDVIVFKNPTDPTENYIKRLIGLPGEDVEIIDGDIYINGQIARKPPKVQQELWMPVYDHDFRPVDGSQPNAFNGHRWQIPFDLEATGWAVSENNPTQLVLDCPPGEENVLHYRAPSANSFGIAYAYNDVRSYDERTKCSDLMVRFYVRPEDSEGRVGITLGKYGVDYKAWLDLSGQIGLSEIVAGRETVLQQISIAVPRKGQFTQVKFAVVDHQLLFECNGHRLHVELGREPTALQGDRRRPPEAAIFGAGKLTLAHVALYRDIYYTGDGQSPRTARAVEGSPFRLNEDEFFVLGDNSPNSEDGRWWHGPDMASRGWEPPRAGVVPRHYLVGKALFVYWPSGFEFPWPRGLKTSLLRSSDQNMAMRLLYGVVSLRWIPNVGRMRFIYGGTRQSAKMAQQPPRHARNAKH